MKKSFLPLASLLVLLLTACGKGDFAATSTIPETSKPAIDPTLTYYHAYGDSITAGTGVADPSLDFVSLVGNYNKLPITNEGVPGIRACGLAGNSFPLDARLQLGAVRGLNTLLIGTNDVVGTGAGPFESTFNLCQQALISWLAVPETSKVRGAAPSVTTTGNIHIEYGLWNSMMTDALGAQDTFPITTPAYGPIYVWYQLIDDSIGTFTYALDGKILGTMTTAPTVRMAPPVAYAISMGLLRIPSVPAGKHTLTFTQTSTAAYGSGIIAVGAPSTSPGSSLPRTLVGTVPPELNGLNAAAVAAYNTDTQANVALLKGDGLNLSLFQSGAYMSATTADLNADGLHPNALGYDELYQAIEDALTKP